MVSVSAQLFMLRVKVVESPSADSVVSRVNLLDEIMARRRRPVGVKEGKVGHTLSEAAGTQSEASSSAAVEVASFTQMLIYNN